MGAISLPFRPSLPSIHPRFSSPPFYSPSYSCFLLLHSLLPLSPLLFFLPIPHTSSSPLLSRLSFISPIYPASGSGGAYGAPPASPGGAWPPNDFWCTLTPKLSSFPFAYWSAFVSYFTDFITKWCYILICLWSENNGIAATGFSWPWG